MVTSILTAVIAAFNDMAAAEGTKGLGMKTKSNTILMTPHGFKERTRTMRMMTVIFKTILQRFQAEINNERSDAEDEHEG